MISRSQDTCPSLRANAMQDIRTIHQNYLSLWWTLDIDAPILDHTYALREKFPRERALEAFFNDLVYDLSETPHTRPELRSARDRIMQHARSLAVSALDFEPAQLDVIERNHFAETAIQFVERSRQFDPDISAKDIFQGGRNAWSMNLLQYVMGLPVEVTPAILAYSLMYPYSDNYLDDPTRSRQTKLDFSRRFGERLVDPGQRRNAVQSKARVDPSQRRNAVQSEARVDPSKARVDSSVQPANAVEAKIFDLVSIMEDQYDRQRWPQVWESLVGIHNAQMRSLALLSQPISPYEGADVLDITFAKGGAAVLADGYLVA
ncbi:MAG TPA: hypothetical protein VLH85_02930, partial [Levilinea sp.]|nr:hypothetical protein [Levilinea sp.]